MFRSTEQPNFIRYACVCLYQFELVVSLPKAGPAQPFDQITQPKGPLGVIAVHSAGLWNKYLLQTHTRYEVG